MNGIIEDDIELIWGTFINADSEQTFDSGEKCYSLQDWGIVISQLILPTLSLLVNIGCLLVTSGVITVNKEKCKSEDIGSFLKKKEAEEDMEEIRDILENYNLNEVDIDKVMDAIVNKLSE